MADMGMCLLHDFFFLDHFLTVLQPIPHSELMKKKKTKTVLSAVDINNIEVI